MKQQNYAQTKSCLARNMRSQHFRSLPLTKSSGIDDVSISRARLVYIYQKHSCQNEGTMNISYVRVLMCAASGDDKTLSL